ncbi:MAG: citrate lyase acyl carrier protein [Candidatus Coatesbacteria bacterium]|nr:citrate lyase acyl carrier protein [Candidatus Coatesbacteria bacterium]
MEIINTGQAGTVESSDCIITVSPSENGMEINIESTVKLQFGDHIRDLIIDFFNKKGIVNVSLFINDRGALDYVILSRLESAVLQASGYKEGL